MTISLSELELAVANDHRFDHIDRTHLHRATFEDDLDFIEGRDLLRERRIADTVATEARETRILSDLGDMIAFEVAGGWRGHRWVRREGAWIAAETLVLDGSIRAKLSGTDHDAVAQALGAARPVHSALGELRPGRGQHAEEPAPRLPVDWPAGARAAAAYLHAVWNQRALGLLEADEWRGPDGLTGDGADQRRWLMALLTMLPDAVLLFERALVAGDTVAVAWRMHGHHLGSGAEMAPTGRRIRAIGSSLLTMDGDQPRMDESLIDTLALRAQLHRPVINYGRIAEAPVGPA